MQCAFLDALILGISGAQVYLTLSSITENLSIVHKRVRCNQFESCDNITSAHKFAKGLGANMMNN